MKRSRRNRVSLSLCILLVVALLGCGTIPKQPVPSSFHLVILHTNDFHGADFSRLAREAALIKKVRSEERYVLYLDAGDVSTYGPYHTTFYGEVEFAVLNALRCDALTLGNHEFDAMVGPPPSKSFLPARLEQATFPVLCANVKNAEDGGYPSGVRPYIVKELGGLRIGIIGLTTTVYSRGTGLYVDWSPTNIPVALFAEVAAKSDVVIALTHLGSIADIYLARALPDLACIVGGHSHEQLDEPLVEDHIPIVQAGCYGSHLGRLDLYFQLRHKRWTRTKHTGMLIRIDETLPEDPEIASIIESYLQRVRK